MTSEELSSIFNIGVAVGKQMGDLQKENVKLSNELVEMTKNYVSLKVQTDEPPMGAQGDNL